MTDADANFDRLMDATQTLIQLKVGDVLTQEMIDDLNLVDANHREDYERATDAFHRGYEAGLVRGAGADTARLIEERDEARTQAVVARALGVGAEQIKHMVQRFLSWRLPENFHPDAGISFKATFNDHLPEPMKHNPTGTNLFDADQAEAMVRHMVDGLPQG
jgi:hypothetical protein